MKKSGQNAWGELQRPYRGCKKLGGLDGFRMDIYGVFLSYYKEQKRNVAHPHRSYPPSRRRGQKEGTSLLRWRLLQKCWFCHPERSEGSQPFENTRCFALLRMTYQGKLRF
jgi:hypothetical protein